MKIESDEWKPNHSKRDKPFGLRHFSRSSFAFRQDGLWEYVSWHETERARDDAIASLNKKMYDRYSAPVAMMKVER